MLAADSIGALEALPDRATIRPRLIRQVIAKECLADADTAIGPQAAAPGSTSTGSEVPRGWLVDGVTDTSHSAMPNIQIDHCTQSIKSRQAKPPLLFRKSR